MNKEYFADSLSIEDIAEMTDKMLKYERMVKNKGSVKANLLKIIPAAAVILLVVGLMNYASILNLGGENYENNGSDVNIIVPGSAVIEQNETDIFEEIAEEIDAIIEQEISDIDWEAILQRIGNISETDRNAIAKANDEGYIEEVIKRLEARNSVRDEEREAEFASDIWLSEYMKEEVLSELIEELETLFAENPQDYWNNYVWRLSLTDERSIFTLKNGIIIETSERPYNYQFAFRSTSDAEENPIGFMAVYSGITIKLANGIIIETFEGVNVKADAVKDAEHELEIKILTGSATLTYTDGTSITIERGTVLDGEGNIIK